MRSNLVSDPWRSLQRTQSEMNDDPAVLASLKLAHIRISAFWKLSKTG